jgi:17 kDa outer membrane surface antigen
VECAVASAPHCKGTLRRWHALLRRLPQGACLFGVALAAGGCSFSYQLDTLFGKRDAEQAGSLRPAPKLTSEAPAEGDLAIARAAVSEVLTKGGKDASLPWENPQTGTRGTVTPLATAYTLDGNTCRDFLASFVKNGSESWLQGEACRASRGKWEVRSLRPWKST